MVVNKSKQNFNEDVVIATIISANLILGNSNQQESFQMVVIRNKRWHITNSLANKNYTNIAPSAFACEIVCWVSSGSVSFEFTCE